jgi:hypothetical protein
MSHPMGQRVCLSSARTGDNDEGRRVAMFDGLSLFWV